MKRHESQRGFTLIELLIVIGIMGVLAAVIVLAINPAQMLAKSRDSQRISDMSTLQTAINLALSQTGVQFTGTADRTYATEQTADRFPADVNATCLTGTTKQSNDGNGWIPLNFAGVQSGAPISVLPVDPSAADANAVANDLYYRFIFNSENQYKIDCKLEATENSSKMSSDGGTSTTKYEVGTNLQLGES